MKAFIVCGYGIPKDIHADQNYLTYLNIVFNRIYSEAKDHAALIIPCGGPTACTPPYLGTEAESMGAYLNELIIRDCMNATTRAWQIVPEDRSLSSLENLLFAKDIVQKYGGEEVVVFCEATRVARNTQVLHRVFPHQLCSVQGIDFDISQNRYLANDVIEKKERAELEHVFWALESEEHLAEHHAFFEEKFRKLRQWDAEGMTHADAVTRWFKEGAEMFSHMTHNK